MSIIWAYSLLQVATDALPPYIITEAEKQQKRWEMLLHNLNIYIYKKVIIYNQHDFPSMEHERRLSNYYYWSHIQCVRNKLKLNELQIIVPFVKAL